MTLRRIRNMFIGFMGGLHLGIFITGEGNWINLTVAVVFVALLTLFLYLDYLNDVRKETRR